MIKKLLGVVLATTMALGASALERQLIDAPVNLDNGETGWYPGLCIQKGIFTSVPAGTIFTIDYTLNPDSEGHSFKLCSSWSNKLLPGFEGNSEDGTIYAVTEDGSYEYTITEETISKLDDSDFTGWDGDVRICGEGLTITAAYLTLADEESLAECPVDMTENWWPGCTFQRSIITGAEPEWQIQMTYELIESSETHQFAITTSWGNAPIPGFVGTEPTEKEGVFTLPLTENGIYKYTITEDDIKNLDNSDVHGWDGDIRIVGVGFTITKLVLNRNPEGGSSSIDNCVIDSIENAQVEYYNLQGVRIANPSNGIFIKRQGTKTQKIVF